MSRIAIVCLIQFYLTPFFGVPNWKLQNQVNAIMPTIKSLEFMKARELNMRETRTFNSRGGTS